MYQNIFSQNSKFRSYILPISECDARILGILVITLIMAYWFDSNTAIHGILMQFLVMLFLF